MFSDKPTMLEFIPRLCMSLGINKSLYNQKGQMIIGHMPISLYPYELSSQTYYKLIRAHRIWQSLLVKAASDKQFIRKTLSTATIKDEFLRNFFNIYKNHSNDEQVGVAVTRIDYMGDEQPKLVQYNLMSVGLNSITDRVQQLTNILKIQQATKQNRSYPVNRNQSVFVQALQAALQSTHKKQGYILMMVHDNQFNFGDQNAFFLQMIKRGYKLLRVTMNQFMEKMKFDQQTRQIYYDNKLISCFYFRTSYSPAHFPTQQHWKVRSIIQSSKAIKIPSIKLLLVNFKRVQAQLSKLDVLKKFLSSEQANIIHELSGDIQDFDDISNIQELIDKTQKQEYVLKPNREGGGFNFFGKQVFNKLKQLKHNKQELQQYIIMKKIQSKVSSNVFISNFKFQQVEKTTCQFSTFGSFMYKGSQVFYNEAGGSLVRLKKQQLNEGGIAIDQAVISSLCLIDQ